MPPPQPPPRCPSNRSTTAASNHEGNMISSAAIIALISGFQAVISAAPGVIAIVQQSKDYITSLFKAGKITKEQQDAVHRHIDSIAGLVAAGIVPPAWTVEPNPPKA